MKQIAKQLGLISMCGVLLLPGCGGGQSTSDDGITGTGVTRGRITNFGSIWVNGVRYTINNAALSRDGDTSVSQQDFYVGDYVEIEGSVNGNSGTATTVTFDDLIEGIVTAVTVDTLTVLDTRVHVDSLTSFHGVAQLSALVPGNVVEISGYKDAAGEAVATSIVLKQQSFIEGSSKLELEGQVTNLDTANKTLELGGYTIEYANARFEDGTEADLNNGVRIEIESNTAPSGNTIVAAEISFENEDSGLDEGIEVEIEGKVTQFVSAQNFSIGSIQIRTNAATQFEHGSVADLALNTLLEVEGRIDSSGVLVAEEISFKETTTTTVTQEISGVIQSIDQTNREITVGGLVVVLTDATLMDDETLSTFTINDLQVGDKVEVKGLLLADGKIQALKLERENEEDDEDDDDS